MINITILRDAIRMLLLLVERAVKDGYDRLSLSNRILFSYVSSRYIAQCAGSSHQTIGRLASKLLAMPTSDMGLYLLDDADLFKLFYPDNQSRKNNKRRPPYELIEQERTRSPKKYGKKIKTIYLSYRAEEPSTSLGQSRFFELVAAHLKQSKLEARFDYEPGEALFVDFAGMTLSYKDKSSGKRIVLYVFVCVLGFSKKMFAIAVRRMTAKNWVNCLVEAFNYFGGRTETVHFDNAQLVNKAGLIPELQSHARAFASYYDVICNTSRVGTPRDNPNAEKSVQFIENRVLVYNNELKFSSLEQANAHLLQEVEKLNNEPMQRSGRSRNELFESSEVCSLKELPAFCYRPFDERFQRTASASYLVRYQNCEYSVPYKYRNKEVTLELRDNQLAILDGIHVIAEHQINEERGSRTIVKAHMHPSHTAEDNKNVDEFVTWAEAFGVSTVALINAQYKALSSRRSRPAGKSCLSIKKTAKGYDKSVIEKACEYAITNNMTSPEELELILRSEIFDESNEPQLDLPSLVIHENIRGKHHYQEFRHE